jgi:hypothetical protein
MVNTLTCGSGTTGVATTCTQSAIDSPGQAFAESKYADVAMLSDENALNGAFAGTMPPHAPAGVGANTVMAPTASVVNPR